MYQNSKVYITVKANNNNIHVCSFRIPLRPRLHALELRLRPQDVEHSGDTSKGIKLKTTLQEIFKLAILRGNTIYMGPKLTYQKRRKKKKDKELFNLA